MRRTTSTFIRSSAAAFFVVCFLSIATLAQGPAKVASAPKFLLPVSDVFAIAGMGTVVTGKIERGKVKVGETVEIVGKTDTRTSVVVAIEASRQKVQEAETGAEVGLFLRGIDKTEVSRGQVIAAPGSVHAFTTVQVTVDMRSTADGGRNIPFFSGYKPQLYIWLGSFTGKFTLLGDKTEVLPGETGVKAEIELNEPAPLEIGQVIGIRDMGRMVGTATVTSLGPKK